MGWKNWELDTIPSSFYLEYPIFYYLKGPITLLVPLNKFNTINMKIVVNKSLISKKYIAENLAAFYQQNIPPDELQKLLNDPSIMQTLNRLGKPYSKIFWIIIHCLNN